MAVAAWLALRESGGRAEPARHEAPTGEAAAAPAGSAANREASVPFDEPDATVDSPAAIRVAPLEIPAWVPTGRLLGRFVTVHNEPVRGVIVSLCERPVDSGALPLLEGNFGTESSNASGHFVFARVPAGLPIGLQGTLPDGRDVELPDLAVPTGGEIDLGDIVVTDASRLQGLVTDARGEFVAGAIVAAVPDVSGYGLGFYYSGCAGEASWPGLHEGHTGPDGVFTLDGLPPRPVSVLGMAPGHGRRLIQTHVQPGHSNVLEIELPDEAVIAGRVEDGRGERVPGVRVKATPADQALQRCTLTDPRGEFVLRELEAGQFRVEAVDPSGREASAVVHGDTHDLVLTLHESSTSTSNFVIEVVDEFGHPATSFDVLSTAGAFDGMQRTALNSADRSHAFSLLGRGRREGSSLVLPGFDPANFTFWARSASACSKPRLRDPTSLTMTLRLEAMSPIHGLVVDAQSNLPLAGAEVSVMLRQPVFTLPDGALWTDASGRFELDNPPAGALGLWARAADHRAEEIAIAPDHRTLLIVKLDPTGSVMLRLDARFGVGPRRFLIKERDGNDQDFTDFSGRMQLVTGLRPGVHDVFVLLDPDEIDHGEEPPHEPLATVNVRAGEVSEVLVALPTRLATQRNGR